MMNHTTFNSELTRAEQTLQQPLETSNIDITEQPIGTAGDDYLYAQSGNDILSGRAGNDYIYSYIEEVRGNIFLGEAGSDTLYGGGGNDALFGGEGNDYLAGSQYNPNEDTYSDFRIIALNCLSDNKSIFFKSDRSKQSFQKNCLA